MVRDGLDPGGATDRDCRGPQGRAEATAAGQPPAQRERPRRGDALERHALGAEGDRRRRAPARLLRSRGVPRGPLPEVVGPRPDPRRRGDGDRPHPTDADRAAPGQPHRRQDQQWLVQVHIPGAHDQERARRARAREPQGVRRSRRRSAPERGAPDPDRTFRWRGPSYADPAATTPGPSRRGLRFRRPLPGRDRLGRVGHPAHPGRSQGGCRLTPRRHACVLRLWHQQVQRAPAQGCGWCPCGCSGVAAGPLPRGVQPPGAHADAPSVRLADAGRPSRERPRRTGAVGPASRHPARGRDRRDLVGGRGSGG